MGISFLAKFSLSKGEGTIQKWQIHSTNPTNAFFGWIRNDSEPSSFPNVEKLLVHVQFWFGLMTLGLSKNPKHTNHEEPCLSSGRPFAVLKHAKSTLRSEELVDCKGERAQKSMVLAVLACFSVCKSTFQARILPGSLFDEHNYRKINIVPLIIEARLLKVVSHHRLAWGFTLADCFKWQWPSLRRSAKVKGSEF